MKCHVLILDTTGPTSITFYEIEKRKETIKEKNKNKGDKSKEKRKKMKEK